jgi:hypothetical protein
MLYNDDPRQRGVIEKEIMPRSAQAQLEDDSGIEVFSAGILLARSSSFKKPSDKEEPLT